MGKDIFIDVHIQVSPYISVSEGHYIAQHLHYLLMTKIPHVKDVTIHVDPEDDETVAPCMDLPSRTTLTAKWFNPWQEKFPCISHYGLHYLDGKLTIDVFLIHNGTESPLLKKHIISDLSKEPTIMVRFFSVLA